MTAGIVFVAYGERALNECAMALVALRKVTSLPIITIGSEPVGILKGNAKSGLFVRCADGWLEIVELQAIGGKRLSAKDYLAGKALEGKVLV